MWTDGGRAGRTRHAEHGLPARRAAGRRAARQRSRFFFRTVEGRQSKANIKQTRGCRASTPRPPRGPGPATPACNRVVTLRASAWPPPPRAVAFEKVKSRGIKSRPGRLSPLAVSVALPQRRDGPGPSPHGMVWWSPALPFPSAETTTRVREGRAVDGKYHYQMLSNSN